jgi:hypothetical protein
MPNEEMVRTFHISFCFEPLHALLAKAVQNRPQEFDVLVDVRNQTEAHQRCSVRDSAKIAANFQLFRIG